jgi:hypothetical protein
MASILKVDKLDPQSGTALEIGTSGDTISVPSGATLDISSATLTPPATLPASSGVNLTALNASNLGSGTVPAARLSGVGKVLQTTSTAINAEWSTTSGTHADVTGFSLSITPATSSSTIVVGIYCQHYNNDSDTQNGASTILYRNVDGGSYTALSGAPGGVCGIVSTVSGTGSSAVYNPLTMVLEDSPATDTVVNYKLQGAAAWGGTARYCYDGIRGYMVAIEIGA